MLVCFDVALRYRRRVCCDCVSVCVVTLWFWRQILGVQRGCPDKDIKQAYRKMALEHHPDKLGANATEEDQQRFMDVRGWRLVGSCACWGRWRVAGLTPASLWPCLARARTYHVRLCKRTRCCPIPTHARTTTHMVRYVVDGWGNSPVFVGLLAGLTCLRRPLCSEHSAFPIDAPVGYCV